MWRPVFFWIRVITIVDEVMTWGEGGGVLAPGPQHYSCGRAAIPPAHCTTNLNLQEGVSYCTRACFGETNHHGGPPTPPFPKHPFTHFTCGAWQLLTK